jgi:hypothetical protein
MKIRGGKQDACVPEERFHIVCRDTRSRLQVNNLHVWCGGVWWGGGKERMSMRLVTCGGIYKRKKKERKLKVIKKRAMKTTR